MARTLLCKLLQKKTYDILSQKYTIVLLFVGIIIVFVSVLHFGETMMEWSKEKYAAVFNPYSDNIGRKSYRSMLCQYVPIDVVYTWVNGSDPKLLEGLSQAREEYGFSSSHMNSCSYSHCTKSHMALVKPQLPSTVTLSDMEEVDPVFAEVVRMFVVSSPYTGQQNVTVVVFPDNEMADRAIQKKSFILEDQNYTINIAYLTDNWLSQNTVMLNDVFLMTQLPSGYSDEQIIKKFPEHVRNHIHKVFHQEEKGLAVFSASDKGSVEAVLKLSNITFDSKVALIAAAYLVVELPSDHEDISASRFTDNEELRYSLRSLEKHAPWVQHVYIITDGQIPHWLNLDNPHVTIVTHEEIFPNRSHLPTFSSPAIECHLHRIPKLSKKFLYLNDDVMFGKDVWPEDFYTHTKGQKVYLSWPVPNCAEGCPSSWIRDGYCDKPCNNSQCQWDGGDCTNDNPLVPYPGGSIHHEGSIATFFQTKSEKNHCNEDCTDTWLADRYCDKACNVLECGFDAGDCGTENYGRLYEMVLIDSQKEYRMPDGELVGYFNLTEFISGNISVTEGFYDDQPVTRSIAISLKYSVMTVVLYPNHNETNITITLKGEKQKQPFEKLFYLIISTKQKLHVQEAKELNATEVSPTEEEEIIFEEFGSDHRFPKFVQQPGNRSMENAMYASVNISASRLPEDLLKKLHLLSEELSRGELTEMGFARRKSEYISAYISSNISSESEKKQLLVFESDLNSSVSKNLSKILPSNWTSKVILSPKQDRKIVPAQPILNVARILEEKTTKRLQVRMFLPQVVQTQRSVKASNAPASSLRNYFEKLSNATKAKEKLMKQMTYRTPVIRQRHLLDTFGDSLRHVNKLYNEAFGYEARKVPSHIAHFVDADVMSRLTTRFYDAFDVTSSHKIRSSNDMQFAFSYYYYLMSEMESVTTNEIFDMFDTDNSGTWSDREIRTVLARLHDLPLDFVAVNDFEQHVINCSVILPELHQTVPTPQYERYYDSKLPTVTKALVNACSPISDMLLKQYGQRKKNKFEIVGEEEVAFKMIHNNLSQVLSQIDDIRKNPKKFICLNDNMSHGTKEADVIRAVIQDFYESLFPTRSQFELPPEYRNRFLYMKDLHEWRNLRDFIRFATYFCLSLLIIFSFASFWKSEIQPSSHSARRLHNPRRRNVNSFQV